MTLTCDKSLKGSPITILTEGNSAVIWDIPTSELNLSQFSRLQRFPSSRSFSGRQASPIRGFVGRLHAGMEFFGPSEPAYEKGQSDQTQLNNHQPASSFMPYSLFPSLYLYNNGVPTVFKSAPAAAYKGESVSASHRLGYTVRRGVPGAIA
jgi:hypothetical protein